MNPAAIDPAYELERFEWKVDAGAEFAITQPVFDVEQLERFLDVDRARAHPDRRRDLAARVGAQRRVSGQRGAGRGRCPTAVIARMRRASEKSKEHAVAEGIAIAREMLERVRGAVQGVQVSAPFGKVELALEVFDELERSAFGAR